MAIDLSNMIDRAVYIRIKVEHPLWPEDLVKNELERLKNLAVAEQVTELLNRSD